MPTNSDPKREQGYYFALAQTGWMMAGPIAFGVWLDRQLGWTPWSTTVGAVAGLVGGMTYMLMKINRHDKTQTPGSRDQS